MNPVGERKSEVFFFSFSFSIKCKNCCCFAQWIINWLMLARIISVADGQTDCAFCNGEENNSNCTLNCSSSNNKGNRALNTWTEPFILWYWKKKQQSACEEMETKAVEYIVLPNFETAQFESYILFHLISVFCHVVVLHLKHANTQRCLLRHLILNKWRVISLTHTYGQSCWPRLSKEKHTCRVSSSSSICVSASCWQGMKYVCVSGCLLCACASVCVCTWW